MIPIGERIQFARKEMGLNLPELAALLQTYSKKVQQWEDGEVIPRPIMVRKLASRLGVYQQWLEEGRGDVWKPTCGCWTWYHAWGRSLVSLLGHHPKCHKAPSIHAALVAFVSEVIKALPEERLLLPDQRLLQDECHAILRGEKRSMPALPPQSPVRFSHE